MAFYCGENVPTGDEKRNTPSHAPYPKQGSEMRPGQKGAWEKLAGLLEALGTGHTGPGVGLCSVSTRNIPKLDPGTGYSVLLLLPPE